ncbi:HNH endonuclease signature motif containing protein [Nocardia lijiangensis]|uniref:HNH endonuclease signature motif containing protein n=1 Tax=Nocardia lijiangensis TaxID=299618 RepID=UPI0012DBDB66
MRRRKRRPGLDDRQYRKARDRLRSRSQVCHICGGTIDVSLPYTDARSWTADHIIPRSKGGHLLGEMKAAHRDCNSRRGNRTEVREDKLPTSRSWLPSSVPEGTRDSARSKGRQR